MEIMAIKVKGDFGSWGWYFDNQRI